jgi:hypothetical protein
MFFHRQPIGISTNDGVGIFGILVCLRQFGANDEIVRLKQYFSKDKRGYDATRRFVAYSAVSLNEKSMDGQSIWQHLADRSQWNLGCIYCRHRITSRASGGVKDGSASKIGVVSGEVMFEVRSIYAEEHQSNSTAVDASLPNLIPTTVTPPKCTPNG